MTTSSSNSRPHKVEITNPYDGGFIGDPCDDANPCRPAFQCLTEFGSGDGAYPGGFCTGICPKELCYDDPGYSWTRCVRFPEEEQAICMMECGGDEGASCRDGYTCERVRRSDRDGSRYVCVPEERAAGRALRDLRRASRIRGEAEHSAERLGETVPVAAAPDTASTAPTPGGAPTPGAPAAGRNAARTSREVEVPESPRDQSSFVDLLGPVVIAVAATALLAVLLFRRRRHIFTGGHRLDVDRNKTPLSKVRAESPDAEPRPEPEVRIGPRTRVLSPIDEERLRRQRADAGGTAGRIQDHLAVGDMRRELREPETSSGRILRRHATRPLIRRPAPLIEFVDDSELLNDEPEVVPHKPAEPPPTPQPPVMTAMAPQDLELAILKAARAEPPEPVSMVRTSGIQPEPLHPPQSPVAQLLSRGPNSRGDFRYTPIVQRPPADPTKGPVSLEDAYRYLNQLLVDGEEIRQRKGYDQVVFIEFSAANTRFTIDTNNQIRVHTREGAFTKPGLALDRIRKVGFEANTTPEDAHLLSLVNVGRRLLGHNNDGERNLASIEELSQVAPFLDEDSRRLVEVLTTPDLHGELIQQLKRGRRAVPPKAARGTITAGPDVDSGSSMIRGSTPAEQTPQAAIVCMCPSCREAVDAGDLACRHCGVALHPRPYFCPHCGIRNVMYADGRDQCCVNPECGAALSKIDRGEDFESRRLTIIFDLLAGFDEFSKTGGRLGEDRYAARRGDEELVIWQLDAEAPDPLTEAHRARHELDSRCHLPQQFSRQGGVGLVTYKSDDAQRLPLYMAGAQRLAESLFRLLSEIERAQLTAPALVAEDLSLREDGNIHLDVGHRLRRHNEAIPVRRDPRYAAPELNRGGRPGPRSDIYTFAAIWYVTMTGSAPSAQSMPLHPPEGIDVETRVWKVIMDCTSADPEKRPPSAEDALARIRGDRRLTDVI